MELRPRGSATKRRRSSGLLTRSRHAVTCHAPIATTQQTYDSTSLALQKVSRVNLHILTDIQMGGAILTH